MCLLLFAYRCHPDYPLLLAANRDEFYRRPTAPAGPWEGGDMVAGRDLEAGGTWAGISRGRVAAVTNIREAHPCASSLRDSLRLRKSGSRPICREPQVPTPEDPLSRGDIPRDFLQGTAPPASFATGLMDRRYRGFNALLFQLGDDDELVCAGNRHKPFSFSAGVHGISNGAPDAPWPKVEKGKAGLSRLLRGLDGAPDEGNFVGPALALLQDRAPAAPEDLPHTGVPPELERALSPIFVQVERDDDFPGAYGTRASTLIAVHRSGRTQLWEQGYENGEAAGPVRHFALD